MKNMNKIWPSKVGKNDDLYAIVNEKTNNVEALVFSSSEKKISVVRDTGIWFDMTDDFVEWVDDPDFYNVDVTPDFVEYFDSMTAKNGKAQFAQKYARKGMTAAADSDCPEATQDIAVNLRNRKNAIDTAMYGPLNPQEPNRGYWIDIAKEWGVDVETAKKQRCGNCAVFIVTSKMKQCIESGLTGGERADEFDAIDAAGELGYCEAFDFKCASARTCRAWVAGGPVADDVQ